MFYLRLFKKELSPIKFNSVLHLINLCLYGYNLFNLFEVVFILGNK